MYLSSILLLLLLGTIFKIAKSFQVLKSWDPNYCNDTKLLKSVGLTKTNTGLFLGYDCSADFYQCKETLGGDYHTYKKRCRMGLIYDPTVTQACNYDFNVAGCGDNEKCGEHCTPDQFACCLSDQCVNEGQRCDEIYDCDLEEDEQNCPTCMAGQFPCMISEICIPIEKRCDGVTDCKDETDEKNCQVCGSGFYYCSKSKTCVSKEKRCDGIRDCPEGEDEVFCRSNKERLYTCWGQRHRVLMSKVCDGKNDCPDGSDEAYCPGKQTYNWNRQEETTIANKVKKPTIEQTDIRRQDKTVKEGNTNQNAEDSFSYDD